MRLLIAYDGIYHMTRTVECDLTRVCVVAGRRVDVQGVLNVQNSVMRLDNPKQAGYVAGLFRN